MGSDRLEGRLFRWESTGHCVGGPLIRPKVGGWVGQFLGGLAVRGGGRGDGQFGLLTRPALAQTAAGRVVALFSGDWRQLGTRPRRTGDFQIMPAEFGSNGSHIGVIPKLDIPLSMIYHQPPSGRNSPPSSQRSATMLMFPLPRVAMVMFSKLPSATTTVRLT